MLQPGTERRRTSSHYTPRSLSAPIVRRTLEPLLAVMGDAPASERILNLKVCDPAMGSGAFLVEACRFLADHVLAAWTREGKVAGVAAEHGDPLLHARQAGRAAVPLRRGQEPRGRRAGEALAVAGDPLEDAAVHVPGPRAAPRRLARRARLRSDPELSTGSAGRRSRRSSSSYSTEEIAVGARGGDRAAAEDWRARRFSDAVDEREKARLFWDAQDALDRVRLIGDLVVGAFFAHEKDKDRETERAERREFGRQWLRVGGAPTEELLAMQRNAREGAGVSLDGSSFPRCSMRGGRTHSMRIRSIVRPIWMRLSGIRRLRGRTGLPRRMVRLHPLASSRPRGSAWSADLCAHFFRRAAELLGSHGTLGLIATNTIAQGDTRDSALKPMVCEAALAIYDATRSMPWPGAEAAVAVAVVHMAAGSAQTRVGGRLLDGVPVESSTRVCAPVVSVMTPCAFCRTPSCPSREASSSGLVSP